MKSYWGENRRRYIFELKNVPADILRFQRSMKRLTKVERMVSTFLQDCVSLQWISNIRTQQIIKLGDLDKFIIVDFFIINPGVILEVDGPEHLNKRDDKRDQIIKQLFGYKVLRVTNREVKEYNKETRESLLIQISEISKMKPREICARVEKYWSLKARGSL